MSGLRTAVTFLTRLPIGDGAKPRVDAAPVWFPVVGAAIGAVTGGVYAAAWHVLPPLAAAALALSVGTLITGGLHQDGLADTADALVGGWDVEQRLAIFKDSRHGTYGVLALILVIAMQMTALGSLGATQGVVALVAAHALGRSGALALMLHMRPVRSTGLNARFAERLPRRSGVLSVAVMAALVVVMLGPYGIALIGAAAVGSAAVAVWAHRKIGGAVGDVLGAAEQVTETLVLLATSILARHVHPWPIAWF